MLNDVEVIILKMIFFFRSILTDYYVEEITAFPVEKK